ncbi:MAG: hypothetical protein JOY82_18595 [Streptosporangiaceae bacterium]|nr:hypothetical protein [Streptosporangiaceae bacterium]
MRRLLILSMVLGITLIAAAAGAAQASGTPTPSPSPGSGTSGAAHSGLVTVRGPHMYNWATGKQFAQASTVTVSQTSNMVNQLVQVSWTGFTPSEPAGNYALDTNEYPLEIVQCKGANPSNPNQCYDAINGGSPATFGADGPGNSVYTTTGPNGKGVADIEIYTGIQNQFLGCDPQHACSLVVIPAQGGDSWDYPTRPRCNDHIQDGPTGAQLAYGQFAFGGLTGQPNETCAWDKRIVVPLHFAPTPNGCPFRNADFTAGGSPMLARAMTQWQTSLCVGSNPISMQYNSSINESEARNDFASGLNDVAFTTQPMTGTGKHPFAYAPVAVSAVSIAYWVDNSVTAQPFTNMRLTPELVTKLLTTSYAFTGDGCPGAANQPFGCDNNVDGNPVSLYTDPQFQKLNPAIAQNATDPDGFQIPTVVSGNSDMTWTTTSWIAANKDAANFLAGHADPSSGMHLNTAYLGLKYPTDQFTTQDSYFPLAQQYSPTYPLSSVAAYQAENWKSGTSDQKDPVGNYEPLPIEQPGDRSLYAIVDESDAANFLFPVTAILNHAGRYVQPTMASMAAAVRDMTVAPDGTRSVNETSNDPNEYPLTMVIYAVVPTGGISAAKAQKIASFLDFVAGKGQDPGNSPGQLPPGFLPLPSVLRAQTLKAANEVLNQTGNTKSHTGGNGGGTGTGSHSPSPNPSSSSPSSPSPSATPSHSPSSGPSSAAHGVTVAFSRPESAGTAWIVLALLIAGITFILAGPAALVFSSPGTRAAIARRARSIGAWRPRKPLASGPRRRR